MAEALLDTVLLKLAKKADKGGESENAVTPAYEVLARYTLLLTSCTNGRS